ncbi:MAG: cell wall-active antibiotics response protein [Cyclobacteriaceae bacterium]|nr:cell wall-active antibiotics response protein [Cyclobacteriaceae bacterium]
METTKRTDGDNQFLPNNNSGKIFSGVIVVIVGCVLLANQMGTEIPRWVISWPMLLIAIGFYVGAKHSFKNWSWMVPVLIGSIFLADRIVPDLEIRPYLWPIVIIGVGLFIIFNPRNDVGRRRWGRRGGWGSSAGFSNQDNEGVNNMDDYLVSVSVFGGVQKNVVTKDFKGGEVTTLFGGSSINLMKSDIKGRAVLELTQIFGGAELIIPANWRLQSEMVSVFGGIEDKRTFQNDQSSDQEKTLVLKGTSIFGGLEIKSF